MTADFLTALANALEDLDDGIGGTVDEADAVEQVGAISVEHIVEASDEVGQDQSDAYFVLCDLLAGRLEQGIDQVLGCLVFEAEPNAEALVQALDAMKGPEGFTPVLPLSRSQATEFVNHVAGNTTDKAKDVEPFLANVTLLLDVATDHPQPGLADAETLLMELAELVERHSGGS